MTRDDPHAALRAAARGLQRDGVSGPALAALFEALEAVEAAESTPRVDATRERPGLCAVEACWRVVETGSTCYQHSAIAAQPHPFEQARMRDRALQGAGDE